jgi:asparagine synthase (glutamine-hydrolysing)
MFRGIHKFHPGHSMVVGRGGIEHSAPYWDISYSADLPASEEALCSDLLQALRRSTRLQMVSDVPVGAFLSGGVDSSAVVGLMSELSPAPVRTFSVGFADAPSYDERVYAAEIARRFGTDHHERIVVRDEIVEFLPRIVEIYDEPLADATSIPIYFIAQLARETGTKVILTGDGSDELFCGYRSWMRYYRTQRLYGLLAGAPAPLRMAAAGLARFFDEGSVAQEMLVRASKRQELFWSGAGGLKESAKGAILSADYRARMVSFDIHSGVAAQRQHFTRLAPPERRGDFVDWMVFAGLKDVVPNQYLYRADRMGMAHGVELRVPFLDHHFVTMATSIAGRWKVRGGEPKYILKKALEPILPRETLYRRKQGFNVPLREWMQKVVVNHIESRAAGFCAETGLFSREGINALVRQSRTGSANVAPGLWNLYFLMLWFDRWMR